MRLMIFIIYAIGAVATMALQSFLEPIQALPILLLLPVLLLAIAEASGRVRFRTINAEEDDESIYPDRPAMREAVRLNLSDEEAAAKFGWQLVTEMDKSIELMQDMQTTMGLQILAAIEKREQFAKIVKGEK